MEKKLRDEYAEAELGDARRSQRLVELGLALGALPGGSLPEATGDEAGLEAAYRFLSNEAIRANEVVGPHRRETQERCAWRTPVVVAHDTTDFVFSGDKRRGLGRMRGHRERGFWAHTSLAMSWDSYREPLGVLNLELWTRQGQVRKSHKVSPRHRQADPRRESRRWLRAVQGVEQSLEAGQAIHVMDREADAYDLMAALVLGKQRFVIRSSFERRLVDAQTWVDFVSSKPVVLTREVPLSDRRESPFPTKKKIHPPRKARLARLGIKGVTVTLLRPRDLTSDPALPQSMKVNVVVVQEMQPPPGQSPVTWRLYTTEPIDRASDLERIVDAYRCRWRIEEYFKALKTGCQIEKKQLESYHALTNLLAVYIPIAWRILRHRTLAHEDAKRPATAILTKLQIRLLRLKSKSSLPDALTVADALVAIAAMGGHLKRNGPPGWITLARGYEKLLSLEEGAILARKM